MMLDDKTLDLPWEAHKIREGSVEPFIFWLPLRVDQEVIGFHDPQLEDPGR